MLQLSNLDQARSHSMEIQNKDGTQFHLTIHDGSGCSGAAVRDSEALSGSARQSMVINIDVFYTHGKGRDLPFLFQSLRYLNFCFKWKIRVYWCRFLVSSTTQMVFKLVKKYLLNVKTTELFPLFQLRIMAFLLFLTAPQMTLLKINYRQERIIFQL